MLDLKYCNREEVKWSDFMSPTRRETINMLVGSDKRSSPSPARLGMVKRKHVWRMPDLLELRSWSCRPIDLDLVVVQVDSWLFRKLIRNGVQKGHAQGGSRYVPLVFSPVVRIKPCSCVRSTELSD